MRKGNLPIDAPGLFFLVPLQGFASRAKKRCKGTKQTKKNNPVSQKPCKGTKKTKKQSWSIYGARLRPIDAPGFLFLFFGTLARFLDYRIVFLIFLVPLHGCFVALDAKPRKGYKKIKKQSRKPEAL